MQKKRKDRRESHPLEGVGDARPLNPQARELAERAGYQKQAFVKFQDHDIIFLLGPAGCGKTWVAANMAVRFAQNSDGKRRVVVSRPAVECGGEKIGFLPGEMTNKMAVWLLPFNDVLRCMVGEPEKVLATFECVPLAFVRGRSFDDCVAVLDEAQNATLPQLRAFLTRIAHGGKVVVCGDPGQSDLPGGGPHLSWLADEMEKRGLAGVVRFPPSAVVRHPLIAGIERMFTDMQGKK